MSPARKAIDALYQGKLDDMRSHIHEALRQKIGPVLEAKKQEIAKKILVKEEVIEEGDRTGQRVRIKPNGGMKEFHGKTGRITGKEGKHYRVTLDEPVHIPGVGHVEDDIWEPGHLKTIKEETLDESIETTESIDALKKYHAAQGYTQYRKGSDGSGAHYFKNPKTNDEIGGTHGFLMYSMKQDMKQDKKQ